MIGKLTHASETSPLKTLLFSHFKHSSSIPPALKSNDCLAPAGWKSSFAMLFRDAIVLHEIKTCIRPVNGIQYGTFVAFQSTLEEMAGLAS